MKKLIKPGNYIFASGIAGLGLLCLFSKDFIVGRPPAWPANLMVNPLLAYLSGIGLILAALFIVIQKKAGLAAIAIAGLIFLLSVLRHMPHFMNDWANAYKSLALFGGALIIAASCFNEEARINSFLWVNERIRNRFILTGTLLLSAFFIACGYAHFKFATFVFEFIPAYIPFHKFWTYFCGICLVAGGLGLLLHQTRTWAAFFLGLMILIWFVFLHIPRFLADTGNVSDRMGLAESFTFVGILFVLAGFSHHKKFIPITPS